MADAARHSMFLVPEQTFGTTPTNPAFARIRHTGTTLGMSKGSLTSEELRPDRQIADFRHGAKQVGGDLNFEFSYGSFDTLLEAVLCGEWTGNVLKAGVKRRFFSILRHFTDLAAAAKPYWVYTGVEVNTLNLTIGTESMVTGTFTVAGREQVDPAESAPTGATFTEPPATAPMDGFHGGLRENGVSIAVITEVSLTLENSIAPRFVVGSDLTIEQSIGRSNVTGQVTAYFENASLVSKFINEDTTSLDFTLTDDVGNAVNVLIPRLKYTGGQPDVSGEGPITLSMPFQALLDPNTETNIQITRIPV